jgi:hypothetical protein
MEEIELGTYQHYKGNLYTVLGVAKHSETEEALVIYTSHNNPKQWWARPYSMFTETILIDQQSIKRFQKI